MCRDVEWLLSWRYLDMYASELVSQLVDYIAVSGDHRVKIRDADSGKYEDIIGLVEKSDPYDDWVELE